MYERNAYLWDMEKYDVLYPGEDVQPIGVGDGYRDFLLSDILKSRGYFRKFIRIENLGYSFDVFMKLGEVVGEEKRCVFLGRIPAIRVPEKEKYERFEESLGGHPEYDDLVLRFHGDKYDSRVCWTMAKSGLYRNGGYKEIIVDVINDSFLVEKTAE